MLEKGEANTLFYRARYLNPSTGRLSSEDPIGSEQSLYRHVDNNPLSGTDPMIA
ncbi:MAG: RHS repeat-associated core domain-containing protein [Acidobacteriota bacterium]